jgi:hypothetical protein
MSHFSIYQTKTLATPPAEMDPPNDESGFSEQQQQWLRQMVEEAL